MLAVAADESVWSQSVVMLFVLAALVLLGAYAKLRRHGTEPTTEKASSMATGKRSTMRQEVADELARLVAAYGRALGEDPRRCKAMLRDLCPTDRAEVAVLAAAAEEGVPRQLVTSSAPVEVALPRLTEELVAARGLAPDAAGWAVASWASALGVDVSATPAADDDRDPGTGITDGAVTAGTPGGTTATGWADTGRGVGGSGTDVAATPMDRASVWNRPHVLQAVVVIPPVSFVAVANLVYGWEFLDTVLLTAPVLPALPYVRLVTARPVWAAVMMGLSCLALIGFVGFASSELIARPAWMDGVDVTVYVAFIGGYLAAGVAAGRLAALAWAKR